MHNRFLDKPLITQISTMVPVTSAPECIASVSHDFLTALRARYGPLRDMVYAACVGWIKLTHTFPEFFLL